MTSFSGVLVQNEYSPEGGDWLDRMRAPNGSTPASKAEVLYLSGSALTA
jgi:hypothetical protein